ncbi:tryptophanyl-tRNA synthetase-like protein [Plenodomus tracheiphilus IPT5]|uniref:Tryptophan--tRNA ligase, mitochondrial n=1 Tax=Plenodomus tracheiphilus IPT5 TaxID=1408161 RepID=A0A6A7BIV0_9PLEO|nr:tryptophanyl-tRNA synthetase-like protein [Plenodomus tracheiphilus IPT5]
MSLQTLHRARAAPARALFRLGPSYLRRYSQEASEAAPEAAPEIALEIASEATPTQTTPRQQTFKIRKDKTPPPPPRRTIFSGIQPTGTPHLGNYLGALRQWVKLQDEGRENDKRFFSIVDWHAITVHQNPADLVRLRKEMLVSLIAVGLDFDKSIIFEQSSVPAHTALMWILSCRASMGYLGRMTQWKSKLAPPADGSPSVPTPQNDALKLGLFSYPVLQAADILLYNTTHVPVGEDQAQHIELTRVLAKGFNDVYSAGKRRFFSIPQTMLSPAKRIMDLRNPAVKMSKSAPNPSSRILINDSKDIIHQKLKSAVTDSIEGVSYDHQERPGVSNLVDIMYYMNESVAESPQELAKDMKLLSMRALKEKVADTVDENLRDVRERYEEILGAQQAKLREGLNQSSRKANLQASNKLKETREVMGLVPIIKES